MGRGRAQKSITLINTAREILEAIQPASVRAVCYQLFTRGLIPDMGKSATNGVSRLLTAARKEGTIPYEWIVDETRSVERQPSWDNPEEYAQVASHLWRHDRWKDQPVQVQVWSEKGTIRGTLEPVLKAFGVPFRVLHGYGSTTTVHDVAMEADELKTPLIAFYVGDWDPSGLHMSEHDLPARLAEQGATSVRVIRLALTLDQIRTHALPYFDLETKRTDSRYAWYRTYHPRAGARREELGRCWELDALNPAVLRETVEQAIRAQISNVAAWNRHAQVENVEVASLRHFLGKWNAAIKGQSASI